MTGFVFYLAERPTFYQYLEGQNLAVNTMDSYCWTADFFKSHFGRFGRKSLADYKNYLLENFKPKTVNLRIQGINKYLDYAGKSKLRVKNVKVQQKSFLGNVISDADYKFLKTSLLQDGQTKWYFVVWFLSATGARVGELVKLKVEHVKCRLGFYSCTVPVFEQYVLAELLNSGDFERHINRIRRLERTQRSSGGRPA